MMDIAAASWWEILLRLILALVLGGLIGLERETVEKPAGLRTHTLVTLGAALFTLISKEGFFGPGAGFYLGAVAAPALVVIVLIPFKALERRLPRRGLATIEVLLVDEPGQLGRIGTVLGAHNVNIDNGERAG